MVKWNVFWNSALFLCQLKLCCVPGQEVSSSSIFCCPRDALEGASHLGGSRGWGWIAARAQQCKTAPTRTHLAQRIFPGNLATFGFVYSSTFFVWSMRVRPRMEKCTVTLQQSYTGFRALDSLIFSHRQDRPFNKAGGGAAVPAGKPTRARNSGARTPPR